MKTTLEILTEISERSNPVNIQTKPLEWEKDSRSDNWYDSRCGFHIYLDSEKKPEYQYVAAWGEGDSEYFATLEEAQDWCQKELLDWINTVAITSPPLSDEMNEYKADAEKYRAINTPEIDDFILAIKNEALHQRERWGAEGDAGKTDADWFWLIGYLAGKAVNKPEKLLHHIITTAAACLNWHSAKTGNYTKMRAGIEEPKG